MRGEEEKRSWSGEMEEGSNWGKQKVVSPRELEDERMGAVKNATFP